MKGLFRGLMTCCALWGFQAWATDVPIQEMVLTTPDGWSLSQDSRTNDTLLVTFTKGDQFLNFYVKQATALDMKAIFANGADIKTDTHTEQHGPVNWRVLQTYKSTRVRGRTTAYYVTSFLGEYNGHSYYGYSRALDSDTAHDAVMSFLDGVKVQLRGPSNTRSITGTDFTGKKYYFGFGDELSGEMGNEVKYDIQHTHDIFTKDIGGGYIGYKALSPGHSGIVEHWQELGQQMTSKDMYVQYSSGHGSETGLMVGVDYDEIRDNALAYPAKEIVIFIMACHSGGLVDSFDSKKDQWADWQSKGRTLFVMGQQGFADFEHWTRH